MGFYAHYKPKKRTNRRVIRELRKYVLSLKPSDKLLRYKQILICQMQAQRKEGKKSVLARGVRYTLDRIVGYLSPISRWNKGKKQEWVNRVTYDKQLKDK